MPAVTKPDRYAFIYHDCFAIVARVAHRNGLSIDFVEFPFACLRRRSNFVGIFHSRRRLREFNVHSHGAVSSYTTGQNSVESDTGSYNLEPKSAGPSRPSNRVAPTATSTFISDASLFWETSRPREERKVIFGSSRWPRAAGWSCSSNKRAAVNHSIGTIVAAMLHANYVLYSRPREPVLPWWSWIVAPSTGILDRWRITRHAATRDASPSGVTSSGPRTFLSLTICRQSSGAADERPDAR